MVRPRFLVKPEDIEQLRDQSVTCGACVNAGDKKPEKQVAFCMVHRIMVSSTRPVICAEHRRERKDRAYG